LTALSLAACEAACSANALCTGFEYNAPPLNNNMCEIHTGPGDFDHTAVINGCSCYAKTFAPPGVSTQPTTTVATTQPATTHLATTAATVTVATTQPATVTVATTQGITTVASSTAATPPAPPPTFMPTTACVARRDTWNAGYGGCPTCVAPPPLLYSNVILLHLSLLCPLARFCAQERWPTTIVIQQRDCISIDL
jgi:hypothetical protein